MANLYDVNQDLINLIEWSVDENGEILEGEELAKKYDEFEMALSDKIENTALWIKNLESDIEAFKSEKQKLAQRQKTIENKLEWAKKYLNSFITNQHRNENGEIDKVSLNKYKFETPKLKISYRKSATIEITDLTKVPKKFIKVKPLEEKDIDKTQIKELLKQGKSFEFAKLNENVNMSIK